MIREYKITVRLNKSEAHILEVICAARSLSPSETVRDLMRDEWKKLIESGQVVLARRDNAIMVGGDADGEDESTQEQQER